jgi:phosphate transport system permease protein
MLPRGTDVASGELASTRATRIILMLAFWMSCVVALLVIVVIFARSLPALAQVDALKFVTDRSWNPLEFQYDMKPMIVGSLLSALGTILLAMPLAIGIATYINFYAGPVIATIIRRGIYVSSAVPTVVYGFWGLETVVPVIANLQAPGVSLLSGILVLTLMIVPTVALLLDISLSKIPRSLINGAIALGASRHRVCFGVGLMIARGGVISAGLLGLGRALGETIVVVMVTGNKAAMPGSVLDPVRTLTANVALEIGYADQLHASVLFFSTFLLVATVTVLALIVYLIDLKGQDNVDA